MHQVPGTPATFGCEASTTKNESSAGNVPLPRERLVIHTQKHAACDNLLVYRIHVLLNLVISCGGVRCLQLQVLVRRQATHHLVLVDHSLGPAWDERLDHLRDAMQRMHSSRKVGDLRGDERDERRDRRRAPRDRVHPAVELIRDGREARLEQAALDVQKLRLSALVQLDRQLQLRFVLEQVRRLRVKLHHCFRQLDDPEPAHVRDLTDDRLDHRVEVDGDRLRVARQPNQDGLPQVLQVRLGCELLRTSNTTQHNTAQHN